MQNLRRGLAVLLAAALMPWAASAQTDLAAGLKGMAGAHQNAATGNIDESKLKLGRGFDTRSRGDDGTVLSIPLVPIPEAGTRPLSANLIVGRPGKKRIREPKNPLTKDGKPKRQASGRWLWWTGGGMLAGAGIGFLLGGPIGAGIGAVLGGLLGFFLGR